MKELIHRFVFMILFFGIMFNRYVGEQQDFIHISMKTFRVAFLLAESQMAHPSPGTAGVFLPHGGSICQGFPEHSVVEVQQATFSSRL